jgi:serine/threonine-protein kinase
VVKNQEQYSDSVKKGYVISQTPDSGEKEEYGGTVYVTVSKGVMKSTVPNVKGLTKEKAKTKLANAKLKCKVVKEYSSKVAKGKVIKQNKKANSKVKHNTTVTITVSKGKKPVKKSTSTVDTDSSVNTDNYDNYSDNNYSDNNYNSNTYSNSGGSSSNSSNNTDTDSSDDSDIVGMVIE